MITPRTDIGTASSYSKTKKKKDRDERDKEKKEREKEKDIITDSIDLDNYIAPDPITRLQQLKEEERIEKELITRTRKENLRRVQEENVDGPYCLCRKGIEGFMMRCGLCYDWFHTSCVSLPKTVNGKPMNKGHLALEAMKDVKYLCPLCARSRRPRLDTLLSLLVSLQKLPVRLPEGEALQFLTERIMHWQEKVKEVLREPRIKEILHEVSLANNGDSVAMTTTKITIDRVGGESPDLGPGIFEKNLMGDSKTSAVVIEDSEDMKEDAFEGIEALPIIRPRDIMEGGGSKSLGVDLEHKETDDPLTLECEEQMTESPKSADSRENFKDGVMDVKQSNVTKQSRPQSPVDVCTLSEDGAFSSNPIAKGSQGVNDVLLDTVEELLMEGDILEVTMDETQQLWSVVQNQRPFLAKDCRIMVCLYLQSFD